MIGHIEETLNIIPKRDFLFPINISTIDIPHQTNLLAESRQYFIKVKDCEYIGFLSANRNKYNNCKPIERMDELDYQPNIVYGGHLAPEDWYSSTLRWHPGMKELLDELANFTGLKLEGISIWANNFVCHKSVYDDFIIYWHKCFDYFYQKYGYDLPFDIGTFEAKRKPAYFLERFTILYFANRRDLTIKQAI